MQDAIEGPIVATFVIMLIITLLCGCPIMIAGIGLIMIVIVGFLLGAVILIGKLWEISNETGNKAAGIAATVLTILLILSIIVAIESPGRIKGHLATLYLKSVFRVETNITDVAGGSEVNIKITNKTPTLLQAPTILRPTGEVPGHIRCDEVNVSESIWLPRRGDSTTLIFFCEVVWWNTRQKVRDEFRLGFDLDYKNVRFLKTVLSPPHKAKFAWRKTGFGVYVYGAW